MIVSKSSLGQLAIPYGTRNFIQELSGNLQNNVSNSDIHDDTANYNYDPTQNGQSEARVVTAKEDISAEEAAIFDQKIDELKNSGSISDAGNIPYVADKFSKLNPGVEVIAYGPRDVQDMKFTDASKLESINGKTIYPCASIIELLLAIKDKIYINGSFDLSRNSMIAGRKRSSRWKFFK